MDARPEFATILDVLSQHGVSFIVVGGVAAVLSGAPVNTLDTTCSSSALPRTSSASSLPWSSSMQSIAIPRAVGSNRRSSG